MPTLKLTNPKVVALQPKPDGTREFYWDEVTSGFGVAVGRSGAVYVAQHRVAGRSVRTSIGKHGQVGPGGAEWNLARARSRAKELLGEMASGVDVNEVTPARKAAEITLREGLALHVANMRKQKCSDRSIDTIEGEIPRVMKTWLDRPLVTIDKSLLNNLHNKLTEEGKKYLANRVIAEFSAIWNSVDDECDMPRNPAKSVTRNKLLPKRDSLSDEEIQAWAKKLAKLSPVRRDLAIVLMFTGLRSLDARTIRWEHIDFKKGCLFRPSPKGGEERAFEVPICRTVLNIFRWRKEANDIEFAPFGGDHGWVFPALTRGYPKKDAPCDHCPCVRCRVTHVKEPRESRVDPDTKKNTKFMPSPHTLRRTFISVAHGADIIELDRRVLVNHSFSNQSVHEGYTTASFPHLSRCVTRIEVAFWECIAAGVE